MPKKHLFVEYIPLKCFNDIVKSTVNALQQGDELPFPCILQKQ